MDSETTNVDFQINDSDSYNVVDSFIVERACSKGNASDMVNPKVSAKSVDNPNSKLITRPEVYIWP